VRVLAEEQQNLEFGIDAAGWVAEGLVDQLTVENSFVPANFEIPVSEWRESIAKKSTEPRSYCLLCGTDWGVSCVKQHRIPMNPELVRGFVHECRDRGTDGIYLFNFFEVINNKSLKLTYGEDGKPYLADCFYERMKAANEPDLLPRRCVHIGATPKRYPIVVEAGESYTFSRTFTPPFARCKLVVGTDSGADIDVLVNGCAVGEMKENEVFPGFEYVTAERAEVLESIHAITQVAQVVRSAYLPIAADKKSDVTLEIKNKSDSVLKLLWIEFDFD